MSVTLPGDPAPTGRLRDLIEQAILAGDFAPGEKLEELALAARFGVSRTPVREALHQLATTGLVDSRPRRGCIVAVLTPERLVEMVSVLAELEALAGRLAARRLTATAEDAIVAAHKACKAAVGSASFADEDERFHAAIRQASLNGFLVEQATTLQRRLNPYHRLQLGLRGEAEAAIEDHGAIVAAIRAGKPKKSATLLRDHVSMQGERFADLLAQLPSLKTG